MASGRRFMLYFAWSRPTEIGIELGQLNNRFPTLFELRRAIWPAYEWASDPARYKQDISGFLDHVILFDFKQFDAYISEHTGHPVRTMQRENEAQPVQEIDPRLLQAVDTLIVVSLDHMQTAQRPTAGELEAFQIFLQREDACLIVCPHHDIGAEGDQESQRIELRHHGDRLVPPQQRIGGYARALLAELGFPIENRYGLRPAASGNGPAPLEVYHDLDTLRVMKEVSTFHLHAHLPHLSVPPELRHTVRVLARQPIDPTADAHPFVTAGNRYFNALLWIPPAGTRAANIFICDATLWSAAFGGLGSLKNFWRNLAQL